MQRICGVIQEHRCKHQKIKAFLKKHEWFCNKRIATQLSPPPGSPRFWVQLFCSSFGNESVYITLKYVDIKMLTGCHVIKSPTGRISEVWSFKSKMLFVQISLIQLSPSMPQSLLGVINCVSYKRVNRHPTVCDLHGDPPTPTPWQDSTRLNVAVLHPGASVSYESFMFDL